MKRILELWFGEQDGGKTYQLKKRALYGVKRVLIRQVVVIASRGEWFHMCREVHHTEFRSVFMHPEYYSKYPVLPTGYADRDHDALREILHECIGWGDCMVIIDEAWGWIPPGPFETLTKKNPELSDIIAKGRHLERFDGRLRPTHLIIASQYPRTVSAVLREQARVIMVARPSGELSENWIRGVAGRRMLIRAQELGFRQWLAIKGRDPRRG